MGTGGFTKWSTGLDCAIVQMRVDRPCVAVTGGGERGRETERATPLAGGGQQMADGG